MMKPNFFVLILAALLFVGCGPAKTKMLVNEYRSYKIIHMDPPKRFYVDLQDVERGTVYRGVYVSKRFDGHTKLWGKTIKIQYVEWEYEDGSTRYHFEGVRRSLEKARD